MLQGRRFHTIPDVDMGRIPDNPATLNPAGVRQIPKSTYVSNPFYFGGSEVRYWKPQIVKGGKATVKHLKNRATYGISEGRWDKKHA
jgi:hypothetical protein